MPSTSLKQNEHWHVSWRWKYLDNGLPKKLRKKTTASPSIIKDIYHSITNIYHVSLKICWHLFTPSSGKIFSPKFFSHEQRRNSHTIMHPHHVCGYEICQSQCKLCDTTRGVYKNTTNLIVTTFVIYHQLQWLIFNNKSTHTKKFHP